MTINLTINDIPPYLKLSKLYETLTENEGNESFDISKEFFKNELVINNFKDLISYIKIFDYWMINNTPDEFYDWIFKNKDKINMDLLNELFHMNDLINQIKIIINTHINKLCNYYSSIGNVVLLKHAHKNGYPWFNNRIIFIAIKNGHLECFKYAYENGCISNEWICSYIAIYGHLKCLKYAHENGCIWNEETCHNAAENGNLECLKYAHENGCSWDENTCNYASEKGHLECLKYAHENGCPWDEYTCSNAAKNGHIECLKYAHENGCIWLREWMCYYAATGDHLECLKYAHVNGCLLNNWIFTYSAMYKRLKCFKYADKNILRI